MKCWSLLTRVLAREHNHSRALKTWFDSYSFPTNFIPHEFIGNEYSVKSLQRYAKALEFQEMINSWVLNIDQWLIQHWCKNKIIFMTRGHFQNKSVYLCVQYLIIITCEYSSTWWILNGLSFSKLRLKREL